MPIRKEERGPSGKPAIVIQQRSSDQLVEKTMQTVFQHDVESSYPPAELKNLTGAINYAARVLAVSGQDDVVILPPVTMANLSWVLDHYESVGLSVARASQILAGNFDTLSGFPEHKPSFFYFGDTAHRVRPNERWLGLASALNSKNNFIRLCEVLGVNTPETTLYDSPRDVTGFPSKYPVYVKKDVSASGNGVWRCEGQEEFQNVVLGIEGPLQVQEALPDGTRFLNVQYNVLASGLERGLITLQLLKGNSHDGNSFPVIVDQGRVWQQTDILARYAYEHGMCGLFAFDVAMTPAGAVLPIECNPRWNGASYPTVVASKLKVSEWSSHNVDFAARTYDRFKLRELAYSPSSGVGVIVVNWACVGDGKIGVFLAGPPATRAEYLAELTAQVS